ncbi:unnamed protein product, partial [Mesorhabditis spiculigera]
MWALLQKYRELIVVVMGTIFFYAITALSGRVFLLLRKVEVSSIPMDIGEYLDLYSKIYAYTTDFIYIISVIVNPIAIYITISNKKIAWPIRLLLISEAAFRTLMCLGQLLYLLTAGFSLTSSSDELSVEGSFISISVAIYTYTITLPTGIRIAHYFISLGRFIALAFNGRYFELALRFPYLQLFIPYFIAVILRVNLEFETIPVEWLDYVDPFLIAHIAALDSFAYEKLRAHTAKSQKSKSSQKPLGLMLVFSSVIYIFLIIAARLVQTIVQIFLGNLIASLANLGVTQLALFLFLAYDGILSLLFLRRPKKSDAVSVTSVTKFAGNIDRKAAKNTITLANKSRV